MARCIAGLCGNMTIFARAAVGDISSPSNAALNFGKLGACIGISLLLGPGVGGFLYDKTKMTRVPMFLAAVVNVVNIIFVKFVMTETLPKKNRTKFRLANANPMGPPAHSTTRRISAPLPPAPLARCAQQRQLRRRRA